MFIQQKSTTTFEDNYMYVYTFRFVLQSQVHLICAGHLEDLVPILEDTGVLGGVREFELLKDKAVLELGVLVDRSSGQLPVVHLHEHGCLVVLLGLSEGALPRETKTSQ
jgi:hypothetical protein